MRYVMTDWEGHKQATSTVLLDLVTTAHTGRTRFSRSERALFTACEFWAASRNRSLSELLNDDPSSQLQAAEESFNVIGLKATAAALACARLQLAEAHSPGRLHEVASALENTLSAIDEPVDAVIARFASEQVTTPSGGVS